MAVKKTFSFEITVYKAIEELESDDAALLKKAIGARKNAYAPYSNFQVGAAVLLENGEIVIGSNQENASYPSGLCAERVAVFQAGAKYPNVKIEKIAISAASSIHKVDTPAAPCGNCRQSISEYEFKQDAPIKLLLMGEVGDIIQCNSVEDILPLGFNSTYLS